MIIFGTRPEAIKMCPIVLEMKRRGNIEYVVCLTGQHREMLNQVMEIFKIEAQYNLNIMKNRQNLFSITCNVLAGLEKILIIEKPDLIMVHGDTTTSFAAGLAGFYMNIPVAHVEAGLRTNNIRVPFPEEFNRQAVDLFSEFYFAPTKIAADNLLKEGKEIGKIYITGNTVVDAMKNTVVKNYSDENLCWAADSKLILLTIHRRENIGEKMVHVFEACKQIVENNRNVKIIYPIHKNPIIRELAEDIIGNNKYIRIIEPLDVKEFHNYIDKCYLVLTDSGGIQEEAPSLGKPVLVLRDVTERPEGIKAGVLKLIGTDRDRIVYEVEKLLNNHQEYICMSHAVNPYGDGHASERIVDIISEWWKE